MSKIFRIKGQKEKYSDEEIIEMIQNKTLKADDIITTADLKTWMKVKDTIYQFYLGEKENETI